MFCFIWISDHLYYVRKWKDNEGDHNGDAIWEEKSRQELGEGDRQLQFVLKKDPRSQDVAFILLSVKLNTSTKLKPVTPKKPTRGRAMPSSMNFHDSWSVISDVLMYEMCHILLEWNMERDWHPSLRSLVIYIISQDRRRREDSHLTLVWRILV